MMSRIDHARGPGLWLRIRDSFFWMVLIGFGLRLAWILLGHTYKFKVAGDNFGFGFEMGRIGRSLALGRGFSSPFVGDSGATAWEPPLYPFIIACAFRMFGVYSQTSAIFLLALNSVFSALTCIPIFLIAKQSFNSAVARGTAWAWILLPPVMFWSTRWVWETSLAALLLTIIFWVSLTMEDSPGLFSWCGFGLLWGFAALTNTSLLAFLPASGLWICNRLWRGGKPFFKGALFSAIVFVVCIAPWIARNYEVFGKFVFIRSNFGAELRLGNGPGAKGTWMGSLHPTKNAQQLQLYLDRGEIAYVAEREREAVTYIQADYGRFALLCVKRFGYFWSGVSELGSSGVPPLKHFVFVASSLMAFCGLAFALHEHRPGAWLFFWLIVSYPFIFYIVFPHPRYRHPIEPELGMLMGYALCEIGKKIKTGRHPK